MKPKLRFGLEGHFTLIASSKKRGRRVVAEFQNLILNAGLDRLGSGNALSHCQVGTGSAVPAITDTALTSWLAGTNTNGPSNGTATYVAGPPDYIERLCVWRFAEGTATGTIAEVGAGWAVNGSLFCRALIKDTEGNPTTITILSDETLDVEYRIRIYPPTDDVTGTRTIGSTEHAYVLRPAWVSNVANNSVQAWNPSGLFSRSVDFCPDTYAYPATSVLGTRTSGPTGGNTPAQSSKSLSAYSTGSFKRAATVTVGLTAGNATGGIGAMLFGFNCSNSTNIAFCAFQVSFSPVIPKDATKILTMTFELSWGRR